jgi:hypothetical protein
VHVHQVQPLNSWALPLIHEDGDLVYLPHDAFGRRRPSDGIIVEHPQRNMQMRVLDHAVRVVAGQQLDGSGADERCPTTPPGRPSVSGLPGGRISLAGDIRGNHLPAANHDRRVVEHVHRCLAPFIQLGQPDDHAYS